MPQALLHDLALKSGRSTAAKQDFVSSLRGFVLNDMAGAMKTRYSENIAPRAEKELGHLPETGPEVHNAIASDLYFKFYSSMRYNAQEMVWRSVIHPMNESLSALNTKAEKYAKRANELGGSLELDDNLALPKNATAIDVHLAPGGYTSENGANDCAAGALYDNGLNVFSFGMMGANLDDIGESMANYIRVKYPDIQPKAILDMGCTIGHNTLAWKSTFPDAEVTGIDVAAPCLRYAHARAGAQDKAVHFKQMNATQTPFEDNSFDIVFSSMFLHELPIKDINAALKEAYRILRPGGLMLNMELPANKDLEAYDGFYLDWDAYYNNEPYYKKFRDQDYADLCLNAGFDQDKLISFITPQYTYMSDADYVEAVQNPSTFGENTGRLASGIEWYAFGARK
jgi:ubiquinone/menaquinone biosynthesis C-methylase UbiE